MEDNTLVESSFSAMINALIEKVDISASMGRRMRWIGTVDEPDPNRIYATHRAAGIA